MDIRNLVSLAAPMAFAALNALSTAGCTGSAYPNTIEPLDEPDEADTTLPDETVRDRFDKALPPGSPLNIIVQSKDVTYGNPPSTPADGGSIITLDRASLCFQGEPCSEVGGWFGGNEQTAFTISGYWDSPPLELTTEDPGTAGFGLASQRAIARSSGASLAKLTSPAIQGFWADEFPASANAAGLGLVYRIRGEFDLDACSIGMVLHGAMSGDPQENVALAHYKKRKDGLDLLAEKDYSNEMMTIGKFITVDFDLPTCGEKKTVTICDNSQCKDPDGKTNAEQITMTLDAQL